LLLIDEIDNLSILTSYETLKSAENTIRKNFAIWLKDKFLQPKGRYFVYSSHIITLRFTEYMDISAERFVFCPTLPVITNVAHAANTLKTPALKAHQVLYYGSSPALVYTALCTSPGATWMIGDSAIESVREELKDKKVVRKLLQSFITGNKYLVPKALLPHMDVTVMNRDLCIRWIPFHMRYVLEACIDAYPKESDDQCALLEICKQFASWSEGGEEKRWEPLFVVVLLIRTLAREFTSAMSIFSNRSGLLPLDNLDITGCSVSYNRYFSTKRKSTEAHTNVSTFVKALKTPDHFPHISIYHPTSTMVEGYDVLLVAYDKKGKVSKSIGWSLKVGREGPDNISFTEFYTSDAYTTMANDEVIDEFFGVSGALWTPNKWKALNERVVE
jgi:hypothetical protein